MDKNLLTNGIALGVLVVGWWLAQPLLLNIGLFALAGAMTNALAVHMLFEKVPFLYGSGVIPQRFNAFKAGIRQLILEQFFNQENVARFLNTRGSLPRIDFSPIINKTDLSPAFNALVKVVEQSSFGGMLAMFGGSSVLLPLQEPFIVKLKSVIIEISQTEDFHHAMQAELARGGSTDGLVAHVEQIVQQRLDELTPDLVKDIIQQMIKQHLGWLVVWGGVFGGILGLVAGFFTV